MAEHRQVPEPGETIYAPRPSWGPAFFADRRRRPGLRHLRLRLHLPAPDLGHHRRDLPPRCLPQHRPRLDPRLLPPPAPPGDPQRCIAGRNDLRPAPLSLSPAAAFLTVAPSLVQQRTMSRIERTPTGSPPSKTTRWRTLRRDISAAARSRLQSGAAVEDPLAHVVGDPLEGGVLTARDGDQQIALGDHRRGGRLGVDHQRRPGPFLDHLRGRLTQAYGTVLRSA